MHLYRSLSLPHSDPTPSRYSSGITIHSYHYRIQISRHPVSHQASLSILITTAFKFHASTIPLVIRHHYPFLSLPHSTFTQASFSYSSRITIHSYHYPIQISCSQVNHQSSLSILIITAFKFNSGTLDIIHH